MPAPPLDLSMDDLRKVERRRRRMFRVRCRGSAAAKRSLVDDTPISFLSWRMFISHFYRRRRRRRSLFRQLPLALAFFPRRLVCCTKSLFSSFLRAISGALIVHMKYLKILAGMNFELEAFEMEVGMGAELAKDTTTNARINGGYRAH